MQSYNLFLKRHTTDDAINNDDDDAPQIVINAELMTDSLHPSVRGYKVWVPRIAEHVQQIMNGQDAEDDYYSTDDEDDDNER
jgi:lysophospholipase L1-like esterase